LTAPEAQAGLIPALRKDRPELDTFLTALAQAYVRGTAIDWTPLFAPTEARHRVDLPTYPFQHQRYWPDLTPPSLTAPAEVAPLDAEFWDVVERQDVDALAESLAVDEQASLGSLLPALAEWRRRRREETLLDAWRYEVFWKPLKSLTDRPGGIGSASPGAWAVVVPESRAEHPWCAAAEAALGARGIHVERIVVGDEVTHRAELTRRLVGFGEKAAAAGDAVGGVLSLLALDETPYPVSGGSAAGCPTLTHGLAGTLTLAQAFVDAGAGGRLWAVTCGAVSVGASDPLRSVTQTQVWGLGRVVGLEHPDAWGGLIDLPETVDERTSGRLVDVLVHSGPSGSEEDQLALRPAAVFARRLVRATAGGAPTRTPAAPDAASATFASTTSLATTSASTTTAARPSGATASADRWRPRGTVLVTGGTGALGSQVARWLAGNGADHLVLTSRRGPLAPGAGELEAELTALGAKVTFTACDIADRSAVAELLDAVSAEHPLTGVVHAAGVGQDRPLRDTSLTDFAEVVAAKTAGAVHLDELLADTPLDAFVLFSSIAGVWGSGAQAAYAAANTFLDGLAERRRARGLAATSIAWGPWADAGMAGDEEVAEHLRKRGLPVMPPARAIASLQRALDRRDTTVTVADVDWGRFARSFTALRPSPLLSELPEVRRAAEAPADGPAATEDPHRSASALRDRLAAARPAERERVLLKLVRTEVAAVLGHAGIDTVQANRAFKELGFDSLTAVELRTRLNTATGLHLPSTLVFDHPTATELARRLLAELLPDSAAGATEDDEPAGTGDARAEADVRRVLTAIPIARLREAGLMDALLRLAGPDPVGAEPPTTEDDDTAASIDAMDVDNLVQMALDNSDS
ncbi:SDR family NAD(P)-dependent oxidoreductase, partial [Streptomyces deserti]